MSDLFRNIVFVLVAGGCLLVTGLNHYVTVGNTRAVNETFHSLAVQQVEANQIEEAQKYGMRMGQIVFFQATRVIELEQQQIEAAKLIAGLGQRLDQMQLHLEMSELIIKSQGEYIGQLIKFIELKDLDIPIPAAKAEPTPAESYHESLLDENGYPVK